jgi:glucose-6-phosphate isomerase
MITRTINVSERLYGIVEYGAKLYNESQGKFLERLLDAFTLKADREKFFEKYMEKVNEANEKIKEVESQITCLKVETSQITRPEESVHSQLINEGLSLIREFSPDKAKELEEKLAQIRSQNTRSE